MVFLPADYNAMAWVRGFLASHKYSNVDTALKQMDMYWRADSLPPVAWVGMEKLAGDAGIKVVVLWRGELAVAYGEGKCT
jgi:hypothetical protein